MPDRIWNGGNTNKYNEMIRDSEDYLDRVDVEGELDPRENINKNMDKPAPISGGDPKNRYRRPEGNNE
tara:strand:+ start:326 stop:529 length:204 start_codon:yes stop_codon:yes gene_type:complete